MKNYFGNCLAFTGLLFFAFCMLCPISPHAQTICGISDSCLHYSSPGNYKCIDGDFTIDQLYTNNNPTGQPILLDPISAMNSPQYVVVNGVLTFNQSYTFATGSELVFHSEKKLTVDSGVTLTLHNSYLHGCNNVWEGVVVNYGGNIILDGNTFENAFSAVRMEVDNSGTPSGISATGNTFQKNFYGIFMKGLDSGLQRAIDAKDIRAIGTRIAVYYGEAVVNPSPVTLQFENCRFESYVAGGLFLNLRQRLVNKLMVKNCSFIDSEPNFFELPVAGYDRYGVLVTASQLNPIKSLAITDIFFFEYEQKFLPFLRNRRNFFAQYQRGAD